jgi:hypothetical protein
MKTDRAGHLAEGTLAAYLLGGLGRAETAVHKRHLLSCGSCQEQLADLAAVRRKLSVVPASLVLDDPALAGDAAGLLLPVPGSMAVPRWWARGSGRRWWPAAAIAAATVAGAVLVPVLVSLSGAPSDGHPPGGGSSAMVMVTGFDASTDVTATMALRPGPNADTFGLRLTSVPSGTILRVVADRSDGSKVPAGRWRVPRHDASTVFELFGSVDVKISDLTGFQVLTSGGAVLVDLTMPQTRGSTRPPP